MPCVPERLKDPHRGFGAMKFLDSRGREPLSKHYVFKMGGHTAAQTSDTIQSEPDRICFVCLFCFCMETTLIIIIKKKIIDYYAEGISFLIVRRGVLLKLKPFEATRQILMSALRGAVCVLAYYLFDY